MFKEFKEFAMRGNVVDMAVGIIIGAAFGTIVNSLVADIIMPPIGLLLGKVDFSNLFVVLREGSQQPGPYRSLAEAKNMGAVTINFGIFVNHLISFVLVAFAIFLVVNNLNRLRRLDAAKEPAGAPTTRECPFCCSVINIKAVRCSQCTASLDAKGKT